MILVILIVIVAASTQPTVNPSIVFDDGMPGPDYSKPADWGMAEERYK